MKYFWNMICYLSSIFSLFDYLRSTFCAFEHETFSFPCFKWKICDISFSFLFFEVVFFLRQESFLWFYLCHRVLLWVQYSLFTIRSWLCDVTVKFPHLLWFDGILMTFTWRWLWISETIAELRIEILLWVNSC